MKNLLYTLVTGTGDLRTSHYLKMFQSFFKSILLFSDLSAFDMVIICNSSAHRTLQTLVRKHSNISFLVVGDSPDLNHALLGKCDIALIDGVTTYEKVLYLDCDIIVQEDLAILFKQAKLSKNKFYAPAEGSLNGEYWYLNAYRPSNISRLQGKGVRSFNTGTFMFVPTKSMIEHFKKIKQFALSYGGKHFFDQSFFNYYFNMREMASTDFLTTRVVMFPDEAMFYPKKHILHFAGLGRYEEKARIMKRYLKKIIAVKKKNRL